MKLEPGYIPAGTTTVNVSPVVGARTLSCEPGNAPGGTVTAKWPSIPGVVCVYFTAAACARLSIYGAVPQRLYTGPCAAIIRGRAACAAIRGRSASRAVGTAGGQLYSTF